MFRLGFGDKLLIRQTATSIVTPWNYRILYIQGSVDITIKQETGLSDTYKLLDVDDGGIFDAYDGKMLLLEIYRNNGVVIESGNLIISHPYSKLPFLQRTNKLLGENSIRESGDTDFQDGHLTDQEVKLYPDNTLTTPDETFDFSQEFVTDYTPDDRYLIKKQIQKARS